MSTPEKNSRNWLILAHCFNMDGRAASQTITDRIPFLLAQGITPVVLSAPTGRRDERFPHYRVLSPAPSGLLFEIRQIIEAAWGRGVAARVLKLLLTLGCLPFYLVEKLLVNLDSHWSWFIAAFPRGYQLAARYRPEIIYSTAGPSSTHLAALLLKKVLGRPWVAEIHDPLVSEHEPPRYQRTALARWLERAIFKNADAVIYFTRQALAGAEQRTGVEGVGHVLRPGAYPPSIDPQLTYQPTGVLHFGHFGSLARDRNLRGFMVALHNILMERKELRGRVVLDVYGTELDSISEATLRELGLDDVVKRHGRLEYDPDSGKSGRQRVIELMHTCDVLLLVHGETQACLEYIPSKLYEYMLTRRPILGVVATNTELSEILDENGYVAVSGTDPVALARHVAKLVAQWENQGLADRQGDSPFTVARTVTRLLEIVAKLVV